MSFGWKNNWWGNEEKHIRRQKRLISVAADINKKKNNLQFPMANKIGTENRED